jgi:hypothetical protein
MTDKLADEKLATTPPPTESKKKKLSRPRSESVGDSYFVFADDGKIDGVYGDPSK